MSQPSRAIHAAWKPLRSETFLRSTANAAGTLHQTPRRAYASSRCLYASNRQASSTHTPSQSTGAPPCKDGFGPATQTCPTWQCASRPFSSTARSGYKTVQEARSRYKSGPFSWKAGALFLASGAGLILYFRAEKARMERKRIADATKGLGKPKVGGAFRLVDHDGRPFSDADMRGRYALVYFGFTHCPDICPEELDKMAAVVELVKARFGGAGGKGKGEGGGGDVLRPVFITCDPARDTPAVMREYLREFHADLIGLTGSWEEIKDVCKKYRVYFSTPPNVMPGQDYLVDHSIYFYLMDPEGDFVEAIGRNFTPEQAAKIISDHISDWRGKLDRS